MRKELSSLDIKFLIPEFNILLGGIIKKIWQKEKQLRIEVFVSGKGTFELFFEPGKIYITEYKRKASEAPEPFAMALRKRVSGQKIINITQPEFERIIEMKTEKNILIFELFSKGNVILCEHDYKIILPLEVQIWKDRKLAPRQIYTYPPKVTDPFTLDFDLFVTLLSNSHKEIVRFLAVDLSLSGLYAEEVCARAKINKKKICSELPIVEVRKVYEAIHALLSKPSPRIIFEDSELLDVVPIEMEIYQSKRCQLFKSFTSALDEYFMHLEIGAEKLLEKTKLETQKEKYLHILSEQEEALRRWKKIEREARKRAELIYNNYTLIQKILDYISEAKQKGLGWAIIKQNIKQFKVIEVLEAEGKLILQIKRTKIEIDFRKSVQANAQTCFEQAKRAKRKIEAVQTAIKELKKKITELEKRRVQKEKPKPRRRRRLKWFEKFRWMTTSDGFLVIGGRDATQNEILFKKHLEPSDIILHADIAGAPLTIVKSEGKIITPLAIREAGEFAAAYSAAWKAGLASVDVYWVKPEQVSKTAPSGQYLPKGSFMIRGQKNYLKKTELKIAVGIKLEIDKEGKKFAAPICGAVQAVNKHAKYFVTLKPGHLTQSEAAKEVKRRVLMKALPEDQQLIKEIIIDDIQRLLPSGKSSIIG